MRFGVVIGAALIGGLAGYLLGTYLACDWLWPGSNLCGLVGVFVTGPLGLILGGLLGWTGSGPRAG